MGSRVARPSGAGKDGTTTTGPSSPQTQFVRESTGLVRSFTWVDALIISLAVTGPTYFGFSSQIGYVAPFDPAANYLFSAVIGAVFMIPLALMYYLFAVSMPRSGGDYVWMGRSLRPGIGFVAGWALFLMIIALMGGGGTVFPEVVLPVFLATMGYAFSNHGLVGLASQVTSSDTNIFLVGLGVIALGVLFTAFGPRIYSSIMKILAVFIFLGTILVIIVLATTPHATFVNSINGYGGVNATYNSIISSAQANGWTYAPVTTAATFASIPFGVLLFNGFNYAVYSAGEVRNVKRGMFIGVIIALVVSFVIDAAGIYFGMNMVGYQFTQAAFSLSGSGHWPFAALPWLSLFVPMVVHNGVLVVLMQLSWLLFFIFFEGALALSASRYLCAWAVDRTIPTMFADVNQRFHFPLKASLLSFFGGAVFIILTIYTTYIGGGLNMSTVFSIVWGIVGVSALVFPYVKKDLARKLPGGTWPVPLLTIAGVLSLIAMVALFYYSVTVPALGPSTPFSDGILTMIFGTGILIFVVAYFYHRSKGIDINVINGELPPE